jgi:hypothetical protein
MHSMPVYFSPALPLVYLTTLVIELFGCDSVTLFEVYLNRHSALPLQNPLPILAHIKDTSGCYN